MLAVGVEGESIRPNTLRRLSDTFKRGVTIVLLLITTSVAVYETMGRFMAARGDEMVRSENRDSAPLNLDGSLALPYLVYELKYDIRTNLADDKRFIMVKFFLAYGSTQNEFRGYFEGVVASEIISRETQIRDMIATVLNGKSALEMESLQGRLQLKKELVDRINAILLDGRIEEVYYGFLVIL